MLGVKPALLRLLDEAIQTAPPPNIGPPSCKSVQAFSILTALSKHGSQHFALRLHDSRHKFLRALVSELHRLADTARGKLESIWQRLLHVVEYLPSLPQPGDQDICFPESEAQRCAMLCDELGDELLQLDAFVRSNAELCAHLAAAFDARLPLDSSVTDVISAGADTSRAGNVPPAAKVPPEYAAAALEFAFLGIDFGALLVALSDTYRHLRRCQSQPQPGGQGGCSDSNSAGAPAFTHTCQGSGQAASGTWIPPTEFTRKTTKYWVHPRHALKLKLSIIKHLPILLVGDRPQLAFGGNSAAAVPVLKGVRDSALTSSVYFDTPDMQVYRERLRREDGATVVRVRWYGDEDAESPARRVFVERKVHREKWTGETSCKERAAMTQEQLVAFLDGGQIPESVIKPSSIQLLHEVRDFLQSRGQSVVLRTQCQRTAFQQSCTNAVRVSLDDELCMIREQRSGPGWCRDLSRGLPPSDVVRFPYLVAEVKLEDESLCPAWLQALQDDGILVKASKFSKYIHGACSLFPSAVGEHPSWLLPQGDVPGPLRLATISEMEAADGARELSASDVPPTLAVSSQSSSGRGSNAPRSDPGVTPATSGAETRNTLPNERDLQLWTRPGAWSGPPQPLAASPLTHGKLHDHVAVTLGAGVATAPALEQSPRGLPSHIRAGGQALKGALASLFGRDKDNADARMSLPVSKPSLPRVSGRIKSRVDAKVFFANERTMLNWLTISVLLMFTALSLLGQGTTDSGPVSAGSSRGASLACVGSSSLQCKGSQWAGALLAPLGIFFMIYALLTYKKRARDIMEQRTARYDDQLGPTLLSGCLIAIMVVCYVLQVVQYL